MPTESTAASTEQPHVSAAAVLLIAERAFAGCSGGLRNYNDQYILDSIESIVQGVRCGVHRGRDLAKVKRMFTTANDGTILVSRTSGKMVVGREAMHAFVSIILPPHVRARLAVGGNPDNGRICTQFVNSLCQNFDGREDVYRKLVDENVVARARAGVGGALTEPEIDCIATRIQSKCRVPVGISRRFLDPAYKAAAFVIDDEDVGNSEQLVVHQPKPPPRPTFQYPAPTRLHGPTFPGPTFQYPAPTMFQYPALADPMYQVVLQAALQPRSQNNIRNQTQNIQTQNIQNNYGPSKEETERTAKEFGEAAKESMKEAAKEAAKETAKDRRLLEKILDSTTKAASASEAVLASSKKAASVSDLEDAKADLKLHISSVATPARNSNGNGTTTPSSAKKASDAKPSPNPKSTPNASGAKPKPTPKSTPKSWLGFLKRISTNADDIAEEEEEEPDRFHDAETFGDVGNTFDETFGDVGNNLDVTF